MARRARHIRLTKLLCATVTKHCRNSKLAEAALELVVLIISKDEQEASKAWDVGLADAVLLTLSANPAHEGLLLVTCRLMREAALGSAEFVAGSAAIQPLAAHVQAALSPSQPSERTRMGALEAVEAMLRSKAPELRRMAHAAALAPAGSGGAGSGGAGAKGGLVELVARAVADFVHDPAMTVRFFTV